MSEVQTLAPTGVRWEEGSKHRDQRTISGCSHCQERFVRSGTQPEKIPHSGPLLGEPLQSATLAALPDLTLLPEQHTSAHAMLHGRRTWMLPSMSDVWVTRYASGVTKRGCYVAIPCKLASRIGMLLTRSLHDRCDLPACRSGTGQQKKVDREAGCQDRGRGSGRHLSAVGCHPSRAIAQ